jgi:predicted Zn-dependent peptidase
LLQEIDKLRKGEFSDDLIESIVNNEKKNIIQKDEKYSSRASILMDEFTSDIDHKVSLEYVDEISKLTKKDIMDFAAKYLQANNYVAIYKRKGEDKSIVKVDKPTITPVSVNREDQSLP